MPKIIYLAEGVKERLKYAKDQTQMGDARREDVLLKWGRTTCVLCLMNFCLMKCSS